MPAKDVCRRAGISLATYYQWKSKYGGMEASDLKRVKELEAENSRLKRLYAGLALENAAMVVAPPLVEWEELQPANSNAVAPPRAVMSFRMPRSSPCRTCSAQGRTARHGRSQPTVTR